MRWRAAQAAALNGGLLRGSGGAQMASFCTLMKTVSSLRPSVRLWSASTRPSLACLTLLAWSATTVPGAAQAQVQPGAAAPSLVITGTRTPVRADQALFDTTVIDRAQIQAAAGRSLAELLAQQGGLQFWSNGGAGQASSVSMRGLEPRHTLVLVDGVPYGSATVGAAQLENLPLDAVQRIEIVRGPLSGLYGTGAVGGVVQIFTHQGQQGLAHAGQVALGAHGLTLGNANVRWGSGVFDGAVSLGTRREKGFSSTNAREPYGSFNPDRDGFKQHNASLQLGWRLGGDWRVSAQALHSAGRAQFDDGPGADAVGGLLSQVVSVQAAGPVVGAWKSRVRVSQSSDEFDQKVSASPFSELGAYATVQRQLSWENTVASALGDWLLLAEQTQQKVRKPGDAYELSSRSISAVAVGLNGRSGAHHWQGAARHDSNSQFGNATTGSAAYGFDLMPTLRVGLSAGTSFVAPSFNLLYFPGFSNPNLVPEEGLHREVHLRWAQAGQQLRLAYFDNRIRGFIQSGPRPTNLPRVAVDGVTLAYEGVVNDWLLSASAEHQDARNRSVGSPDFDKPLLRRAKAVLRLGAERKQGAWTVGGNVQQVGQRLDINGFDATTFAATTATLPAYTTLDLRAAWALTRDWRLMFKLNNLTNRQYETVFGYNQPGREWLLSLNFNSR
jgi:vitamin B12 transporter